MRDSTMLYLWVALFTAFVLMIIVTHWHKIPVPGAHDNSEWIGLGV